MKVPMGPPPPRNQGPNPDPSPTPDSTSPSVSGPSTAETAKTPMGPPPPRNPNPISNSNPDPSTDYPSTPDSCSREEANAEQVVVTQVRDSEKEATDTPVPSNEQKSTPSVQKSTGLAVPYSIPPWSEPPGHPFYIEVLKEGTIIEKLDVSVKGAYMFGRVDLCDFVLEHPTISRFQAVLQFRKNGEAFLYDLGSTHGTTLNKSQVKKKVYTEVQVGDVIRFGQSSRLYIFQGPSELMPPEGDLSKLRKSKIQEEIQDCEASLLRARAEASLADGISWGMAEDATEEAENDVDEVTWQTYKGQLTERQEKTRGKIIKRIEKVANMKKEIDSIRVKDISQGGLTQGQQTQIARNEQRISQIMEELDSLEETLNESIQESIGARVKKVSHSKKKGIEEDEDEIMSDDDEFYDRTKKRSSRKKTTDSQSVETADTLLDKKEAIIKEMEEKSFLLEKEKTKLVSGTEEGTGEDDALDAFMTDLSSELVLDKTAKIQNEISTLQSELDRILYLLKIADPAGEVARKRDAKSHESNNLATPVPQQPQPEGKKASTLENSRTVSGSSNSIYKKDPPEEKVDTPENRENVTPSYTVTKPQWLGAVKDMQPVETRVDESLPDVHESDQFVDYKDRKKALAPVNDGDIEHAAPGLIVRKRKHTEEPGVHGDRDDRDSISSSVIETTAADAVALLLKHKRGYFAADDELKNGNSQVQDGSQSQTSQSKRVLGPEKPACLDSGPDYESWVPPEGQLGDGRTSLNEKFGY